MTAFTHGPRDNPPVLGAACLAAQLMLDQHGPVETIHGDGAQRLRDARDGMGAVLRSRLHA